MLNDMNWQRDMVWKGQYNIGQSKQYHITKKGRNSHFLYGAGTAPSGILYALLDIDKLDSSEKSTKHDPKTRRIDLWGENRRVKYINCLAKKWLMGDMITAYKYLKKTTSEGKAFFSGIHREQQKAQRVTEKQKHVPSIKKCFLNMNYDNLWKNFPSGRDRELLLVAFKCRFEKSLRKHMRPQLQSLDLATSLTHPSLAELGTVYNSHFLQGGELGIGEMTAFVKMLDSCLCFSLCCLLPWHSSNWNKQ